MNNLVDIQSQIEKLQKQATEIKAKEYDRTLQDIVAKMRAFGISIKDLQSASSGAKAKVSPGKKRGAGTAPKTRKLSVTTVAPKYLGPNGESWSGRGLTPRWLAALVAQGRLKEDFAIKT